MTIKEADWITELETCVSNIAKQKNELSSRFPELEDYFKHFISDVKRKVFTNLGFQEESNPTDKQEAQKPIEINDNDPDELKDLYLTMKILEDSLGDKNLLKLLNEPDFYRVLNITHTALGLSGINAILFVYSLTQDSLKIPKLLGIIKERAGDKNLNLPDLLKDIKSLLTPNFDIKNLLKEFQNHVKAPRNLINTVKGRKQTKAQKWEGSQGLSFSDMRAVQEEIEFTDDILKNNTTYLKDVDRMKKTRLKTDLLFGAFTLLTNAMVLGAAEELDSPTFITVFVEIIVNLGLLLFYQLTNNPKSREIELIYIKNKGDYISRKLEEIITKSRDDLEEHLNLFFEKF